jgi:hypothetical protein
MSSDLRWDLPKFALVVVLCVLMSGCATSGPTHRRALRAAPLETFLPPSSQKVVVEFESSLPGQALSHTVWDRTSGLYADPGAPQKPVFKPYLSKPPAKHLTAILFESLITAGVQAAFNVDEETSAEWAREKEREEAEGDYLPKDNDILIPFGRIFEETFQTRMQTVFPNGATSSGAISEASQVTSGTHVIKLKLAAFEFWEKPLDYINLKATVECRLYRDGDLAQPASVFEVRQAVTKKWAGSGDFLQTTDKTARRFSDVVSEEILKFARAELGE